MPETCGEAKKTSLNVFLLSACVLRGEVLEALVLREPGLKADELVTWKVMSSRVKEVDRRNQPNSDELERAKREIAMLEKALRGHE